MARELLESLQYKTIVDVRKFCSETTENQENHVFDMIFRKYMRNVRWFSFFS